MFVRCKTCGEVMPEHKFNSDHKCIREAMALPRDQLLKRLLKSGGCGKAFYEAEMAKLKKGV